MKCAICKTGTTRKGSATVTLEREGTTVVIKETPAEVCDNCGEYYLSEEVTGRVQQLAEDGVRHGAEIEVLRYPAVSV
ncbi:MAG: type II toxin-antitoxin system MqsA family antitoxin [Candidatus Brocadiia bacterium]